MSTISDGPLAHRIAPGGREIIALQPPLSPGAVSSPAANNTHAPGTRGECKRTQHPLQMDFNPKNLRFLPEPVEIQLGTVSSRRHGHRRPPLLFHALDVRSHRVELLLDLLIPPVDVI